MASEAAFVGSVKNSMKAHEEASLLLPPPSSFTIIVVYRVLKAKSFLFPPSVSWLLLC